MFTILIDVVITPAILAGLFSVLALSLVRKAGAETAWSGWLRVLAVTAGFMGCYLSLFGMPPLPPASSTHKLLFIPPVGALLLAVIFAVTKGRQSPASVFMFCLVFAIASVLWLTSNLLGRFEMVEWLIMLGLILALAAFAVLTCVDGRSSAAVRATAGVLAAGMGGVLILGGTASTGFLSIGVAIALGATLISTLPKDSGTAGNMIGAGALFALAPIAAQATFLTDVETYILLPMAFSVLAVPIAQKLGWTGKGTWVSTIVDSVKTAIIAGIPVAISIVLSVLAQDSGSNPYG